MLNTNVPVHHLGDAIMRACSLINSCSIPIGSLGSFPWPLASQTMDPSSTSHPSERYSIYSKFSPYL